MLTIVNNVACWLVSSRETPCIFYVFLYTWNYKLVYFYRQVIISK